MQHSVLLVDALPGLDHLRKEGFDYVQLSWFEDVVLRPGAEHLQGPSQPAAHLLFAEELDFGTETPLGPGRHAVVDGVGGALLQPVHRDGFSCGKTHSDGSLPSQVCLMEDTRLLYGCPLQLSNQRLTFTACVSPQELTNMIMIGADDLFTDLSPSHFEETFEPTLQSKMVPPVIDLLEDDAASGSCDLI